MKRRRRRARGLGGLQLGGFTFPPKKWTDWAILGGAGFLGFATIFGKSAVTYAEEILNAPDFAKKVFAAVGNVNPSAPEAAKLLIIAQAAFETGWGTQSTFSQTNNLFNITAGPSWTGDTLSVPDADKSYNLAECQRLGRELDSDDHGQFCRIDQVWRKYPSLEASISDFLSFISYATPQLMNGDIQYLQALRDHGYYTLDSATYMSKVQSIVDNLPDKLAS